MDTAPIDIFINQGEDFAVQLIFTDEQDNPLNLANPFRMDVKDTTGQIQISLSSSDTPPDFGEIPEIAVSSAIGLVQLSLTSAVTNELASGQYVYDLFGHVDDGDEYAGDQVVRFAKGTVTVEKRITQEF